MTHHDEIVSELYSDELAIVQATLPPEIYAYLWDRLDTFDMATLGGCPAPALRTVVEKLPPSQIAEIVEGLPCDVFPRLLDELGSEELATIAESLTDRPGGISEAIRSILRDSTHHDDLENFIDEITDMLWFYSIF